jgi:hypothetical protein
MPQPEIVIDITPAGRVQGMHRDEFNLGFLGQQVITRASEILFNRDKQEWEIALPVGKKDYKVVPECGTHDSYNTARNFEVKWMNACRLAGVEPGSKPGRNLALQMQANETVDALFNDGSVLATAARHR